MSRRTTALEGIIFISIIALSSMHLYGFLSGPFIFDDIPDIIDRAALRGGLMDALTTAPFRAVTYFTYWLQYQISGGFVAWQMHLFNAMIHTTVSIFLYLVLCRLGLKSFIAFIGAFIFSIHPLMSEAVIYISARGTLLAALFSLISIFILIKPDAALCWKKILFSTIAFVLAIFSKEEAALLPIVIFFLCYRKELPFSDAVKASLPMAAITIIYMAFRFSHQIDIGASEDLSALTPSEYRVLQPIIWIKYVLMLFWPVNQSIEHELSQGFIHAVAGILCGVAIVSLALSSRSKYSVFVIWFAVALIPTSLIPLADPMREMRAYFPSMAVIAAVMTLFDKRYRDMVSNTGKTVLTYMLLIIVLLSLRMQTDKRTYVWHEPIRIWTEAHHIAPSKTRPLDNLTLALLDIKDYSRAEKLARTSLNMDDNNAHAWNNLGLALKDMGSVKEAAEAYERGIMANPSLPKLHTNLANILVAFNDLERAEKLYKIDLGLNPNQPDAHYGLGYVYMTRGDNDAALKEFEAVIKFQTCDYWALAYASEIYKKKGDINKADSYSKRAKECGK